MTVPTGYLVAKVATVVVFSLIEIGEVVVIAKSPRWKITVVVEVSPDGRVAVINNVCVPSGPPAVTVMTPVTGLMLVPRSPPVIVMLAYGL